MHTLRFGKAPCAEIIIDGIQFRCNFGEERKILIDGVVRRVRLEAKTKAPSIEVSKAIGGTPRDCQFGFVQIQVCFKF